MSSTRRTAAPRKRPTTVSTVPVGAPAMAQAADDEIDANAPAESDPQELARELLSQIDGLLRDQPSLDEKDREAFSEVFAASLQEVVESGAHQQPLSEAEFQQTINGLKRHAAEAGKEDSDLARHLAGAIASLEQRQTKLALEFGRRLRADGQSSALAWLRQQQSSDQADGSDEGSSEAMDASHPLRSDVTNSRSRRLRGPPKVR